MLIAGIDVGFEGAVAYLDAETGEVVKIADMPVHELVRNKKKKRDLDRAELVMLFDRAVAGDGIGHAFIELVSANPGQGVSSSFAFGRSFGNVEMALIAMGIPISYVPPAKWKRDLQVPAAKDGARARASQLMPSAASYWPLVKHHGRAESALIAYWGLRSLR